MSSWAIRPLLKYCGLRASRDKVVQTKHVYYILMEENIYPKPTAHTYLWRPKMNKYTLSTLLSLTLAFVVAPAYSGHKFSVCPANRTSTTCESLLTTVCSWTTNSSEQGGICESNKKEYSGCCYDTTQEHSFTLHDYCNQHITADACANGNS